MHKRRIIVLKKARYLPLASILVPGNAQAPDDGPVEHPGSQWRLPMPFLRFAAR